jgi:NDP-sugar pyrophosphorylase family protein
MSKRAIILAGGKGTRLQPYTVVLPKPLMPIGEYPILEVIVRQLVTDGFDHITLAVNHQAALIRSFFGDGSAWNVQIDYSQENSPMGTMGPLRLIKDLPENFLIMNGDILTDLDFDAFYKNHIKAGKMFTISSYEREQKVDYGVLLKTDSNLLCGFEEKPSRKYDVSMGIYMANREVLKYVPEGPYGFDNLMFDLLLDKIVVRVDPFKGYWLDIGRPDDYIQAIEEFESMKEKFLSLRI